MRKRRGLNKIGMLAIALVLALGTIGVTYSAWVDEIYVEGSLSSSGVNTTLVCGTCYVEGNPTGADTTITCNPTMDPLEVDISITNAQTLTDYYCPFTVDNTDPDTLPIKIQGGMIGGPEPGVEVLIEDIAIMGTVIDPGDSATGKVHIYLVTDDYAFEDITYTITLYVSRWNE